MTTAPSQPRPFPAATLGLLAGLVAVCVWSFWPTFLAMYDKWAGDPQYSHGFLVPLFSLYLLWARRDRLAGANLQFSWVGLPLVLLGCGLHVLAAYVNFDWIDGVSLLITLAGLFGVAGGKAALKWSWLAVAFLFFMIPLPDAIERTLTYPLRRTATIGATYLIQTVGIPAWDVANVIHVPSGQLLVAEACSGLSMVLVFFALSTAVVILVDRPVLDKVVIFLSAVPIAVASNVLRIAGTALIREAGYVEFSEQLGHDMAGWVMMPIALAMLGLELWLLGKLFVPAPAADVFRDPLAAVKAAAQPPSSKKEEQTLSFLRGSVRM